MAKTQAQVIVIARYQLKRDASQVFFKMRSSDCHTEYCVTCLDGIAVECDCPARKPCKHMRHCTHLEASRNHTEQVDEKPAQPHDNTQRSQTVEKTSVFTQTSDSQLYPCKGT